MEIHARKTGALICTSCVTGALLAGADQNCEFIAGYGAALGSAFQIADDILDEVSDTATLGKPAGNDASPRQNNLPCAFGY